MLTNFFKILIIIGIFAAMPIDNLLSKEMETLLPIVNMQNLDVLPKNFRRCIDPFLKATGSLPVTDGLIELNASASGQFSEKSFEKMCEHLPSDQVIVIDLRQESHGFINGMAVSWHAENDWANVGKNLNEILMDERTRLLNAKKQGSLLIYEDNEPSLIPVYEIATEEEIVHKMGFDYIRIPITDHVRPPDAEVDYFIALVKSLPEESWIHFHCAAGRGRATTFFAMYDMICNAKNVSYEDIMARQCLISGKDLNELPQETHWKYPYLRERADFLINFYRYCNESDNFNKSWSAWSKASIYP